MSFAVGKLKPNRSKSAFCKKLVSVSLLLTLASYTVTVSATQSTHSAEPDAAAANADHSNKAKIVKNSTVWLKDWKTYELTTGLNDGTSLHQYVSEVSSLDGKAAKAVSAENESDEIPPEPTLRLGFVPRFNCAPIVSLVFPMASLEPAILKKLQAELDDVRFKVDGTSIEFPALIENADSDVMVHYDAELRRRNNFRILVEAGNTAEIEVKGLGNEPRVYEYSLNGSKRSISRSLANCLSHSK